MGIDISLIAERPRGLLGRKRFGLERIGTAMLEAHPMPAPLDRLSQVFPVEAGRLWVRLFPLEEDVNFQLLEDGRLQVSARTSSLGPGYHARLVDILDAVAEDQGFEWTETEEAHDETGYFEHRDFDRLQDEFETFFNNLANVLVEDERFHQPKLAMEVSFSPIIPENMIAILRGFRPRSFLEHATRAAASDYFPWWDRELTGTTALSMAEAVLWMLFPWRTPENDYEQCVGEIGQDLLMRVQPLPGKWPQHLAELIKLLQSKEALEPAIDGIGYIRGDMSRPLTGAWTVTLQGWFFEGEDDDGGATVYWCNSRALRGTTYSRDRIDPFDAEDACAELEGDLRFVDDGFAYAGTVSDARDDHWPNGRELQGQVVCADGLALITITYDSAEHDAWAEAVFRSVKKPIDDGSSD